MPASVAAHSASRSSKGVSGAFSSAMRSAALPLRYAMRSRILRQRIPPRRWPAAATPWRTQRQQRRIRQVRGHDDGEHGHGVQHPPGGMVEPAWRRASGILLRRTGMIASTISPRQLANENSVVDYAKRRAGGGDDDCEEHAQTAPAIPCRRFIRFIPRDICRQHQLTGVSCSGSTTHASRRWRPSARQHDAVQTSKGNGLPLLQWQQQAAEIYENGNCIHLYLLSVLPKSGNAVVAAFGKGLAASPLSEMGVTQIIPSPPIVLGSLNFGSVGF